MKTIRLTVVLCFVLGLAGVFPGAHLTFAQLDDVCARPDGLPAPPADLVTAAQVESGDGTLADFVEGYRQYSATILQMNGSGYLGCLVTQEGPFNYGSTYIVTLTPNGRVAVHGRNLLLSGGLLDSTIFGPILQAARSSDVGGPFMLEAANAAGYARGSVGFDGFPTILVAGFDLQESHVLVEDVDPGDVLPVTAHDVVERETLKAFVIGTMQYIGQLWREEGRDAFVKLKKILRSPTGPWRAGPVYLFIMDGNGFTLFHGAFPERYELRAPTDVLRDAVTGELILPQIIEAATQSERGGYVEYHFDDPNDDTDSAEIPKVTYARGLSFTVNVPGSEPRELSLIVGSGFYKDGQMALDFAHFGNGDSFSSDVVLVNLAATPIQPLVFFYDTSGELIDPESLVDVTDNLQATVFGGLTPMSEIPSLGEVTISTNGMGDLVTGSVKVVTEGLDSPIGGVLRFDFPGVGVAGVGASQPLRDAIIPVRRQAGGINTGMALRNLSESELELSCRLMMGGEMIEMQPVTLPANGQSAMFIDELFDHDTSDFTGSVRCTAPAGQADFTGVGVEMDVMNGIFTTLPVVPVDR